MISQERMRFLTDLDLERTNEFDPFEDVELNEEEKNFIKGLNEVYEVGFKAVLEGINK